MDNDESEMDDDDNDNDDAEADDDEEDVIERSMEEYEAVVAKAFRHFDFAQ